MEPTFAHAGNSYHRALGGIKQQEFEDFLQKAGTLPACRQKPDGAGPIQLPFGLSRKFFIT
jgi:hypothetical protein